MDKTHSLAQVSDLADYIGEAISEAAEQAQARMLLAHASSLVRSAAGRPEWGVDDTVLVPDQAFWVTLACAARAFTNFDGFEYESVDDWRAGGRKVEELGLYLTATERRVLDEFRPRRGPLSTVETYRDSPVHAPHGGLVPVEGSSSMFPWY